MRRAAGVRRLVPTLLALLIAGCAAGPVAPALTVGSTPDPQTLVLAHVYAAALRNAGTATDVVSSADPVSELDSGPVNVVPGFTGRLLRTFQPGAAVRSDKQVYRAMVAALPEGIAAGDYATAAQDKPALAVSAATVKAWGSTDLAALSRHCRGLVIGAVSGDRTPSTVGGCRLPAVREFPDAATLFAGLRDNQVGAAWTSTAAVDIPTGMHLLVDGTPALLRAENVVPLYRCNELTERQLLAINEVAGVLDTAALVALHRQVDDGADPRAVADAWLAEHPLGH